MSEFKRYRKKQLPYLTGGMIARNPQDHGDQWYVSKVFFEMNYEEA